MAVEENNFQFVHLKIKFSSLTDWVYFSGVYGSPNGTKRRELWSSLELLAQNIHNPWMLVGDFNAMLTEDDKQGGLRHGNRSCSLF